jgi:hypothetical protein
MKKWCKVCQSSFPEREGGIFFNSDGKSLYWACSYCIHAAKASGRTNVKYLRDIAEEEKENDS